MILPDKIIISGFSGGLGRKLAEVFPAEKVLGINHTNYVFDSLSEQVFCDISNYKQVSEVLYEHAEKYYGQRLAIILAAGALGTSGSLKDVDLSEWEYIYRTNVLGNLAILKVFLKNIELTGFARIVFISGGGSAYGFPLFGGYSLSKVAIVREVENISLEFTNKLNDFSIIALAPGAMETNMLRKVREAGAEVRTVVDIGDTAQFIKNFTEMPFLPARALSGKFIHVKDDLNSPDFKDKWMLRRIE